MTREKRLHFKAALATWVSENWAVFHVTAELPPNRSRAELEDRIREWYIRINRRYLGRNWCRPENADRRISGVVFFEQGACGWHAHMLVKPPSRIDPLKFAKDASAFWNGKSQPGTPPGTISGITADGKMLVQVIGNSPSERVRVAGYDAKSLEFHDDVDASRWKFIDQLTALRRQR